MIPPQSDLPPVISDLIDRLLGGDSVLQLTLWAVALILILSLFVWSLRNRRPRIVLDGSNVMHWVGERPSVRTLRMVVSATQEAGFRPLVWFDANAGYKLGGRYMGPAALARELRLHAGQVRVAPKGTPADPLLLADARRMKATVVSNDRFRDWQEEFPDILPDARMVRGRIDRGQLTLDIS